LTHFRSGTEHRNRQWNVVDSRSSFPAARYTISTPELSHESHDLSDQAHE